ncbi:hypothetical protein [Segetibacter aerophilus]|uniref:Uncharacterized protein n=1 Tax=Segetibacter aerophilus TaxID=670293 RepID=A0A512BF08_9BACT|nr:hypothetical protein [Segetibacter aerophilus]GEO10550.1 hypothetical protein SAE01_30460 [Segetibacter aerophilus]
MPTQKYTDMKIVAAIAISAMCVMFMSCNVGKGCPSSGRNVGAEKILSGDPKAIKDMKKARKFRS